jgi:putative salt-induced outer membrane protein YdiY
MLRMLCIIAALGHSSLTLADTLIMKNGDRITGRLDSISAGKAVFETQYAGRILVSLEQVSSMVTDDAYTVRLNDQSLSGAFFSASEGQALFTRDGNERLALSDIRSASQSRTQFTPFSLDWGVRLDLALSLADGNSSTEASNALLEADFQDDLNAHLLTVLLAREEGEGLLTKDQLDVDYGYRRFISQRWYGAANAEYFQDTLKDIDLRITLGAGMGIQVIDNSLENLATDLSLSAVQENIGGDSSTKPALRWGLDYQRFLFAKTVEVFHRQSILQLFSDENGQVYSSSTGIRYAFSERIDTNFRIDLAYESDPPPGNEKTDTTYSLGVGLKF